MGIISKVVRSCLLKFKSQNRTIMKTMTCKQLGGACDKKFHAETFEEMAEKSKNHGMEMAKKGDKKHLKAMAKMKDMSQEDMQEWFGKKKKEFEALPADE